MGRITIMVETVNLTLRNRDTTMALKRAGECPAQE